MCDTQKKAQAEHGEWQTAKQGSIYTYGQLDPKNKVTLAAYLIVCYGVNCALANHASTVNLVHMITSIQLSIPMELLQTILIDVL